MKRTILAAASGLALFTAAPLQAEAHQEAMSDEQAELAGIMEAMGEMFPTEPLTAEQEARLPQATRIVALIIPDGTMGELMGTMMDDMLTPMMDGFANPANTTIAEAIGVTTFDLDLDTEQAAELARLFDPAFQERHDREMAIFPELMGEMFTLIEPSMRKAMSELYAIHFDAEELTEIEAFFATETGSKYARESFAMASDPRMMGASMEMLPALMGAFGDFETRMSEAVADLPEPRSYSDLTQEERTQIIGATGFTDAEIRSNISASETGTEVSWGEEAGQTPEEAEAAKESARAADDAAKASQ